MPTNYSFLRRSITAVAVATLIAAFAAVGVASASTPSSIAATLKKYEAPNAVPWTAPGPPLKGVSTFAGKTVWYIPIYQEAPIFGGGILGLKQSLAKLNMKLQVCDGQATPSGVSACVGQATNAGAVGIVADAVPYSFAATAFNAAIAAHIPLVFMNQPQPGNAENDKQASIFAAGQNTLSKLQAEWVIHDSGGKANVLAVEDVDSSLTTTAFAIVQNEFKSACPGCKVTVVKTTSNDQTNLPSLVSSALAQNPEIDYLMPEIDEVAPSAISGLETGNHTNIKVVSTTGVISSVQDIAAHHYLVADAGGSEYADAWAATDQLLRMLLKKPVDMAYTPPIRIFDTDNVGSLTLTTAAYDNASWYGSTAFESDFLKLWGVKS